MKPATKRMLWLVVPAILLFILAAAFGGFWVWPAIAWGLFLWVVNIRDWIEMYRQGKKADAEWEVRRKEIVNRFLIMSAEARALSERPERLKIDAQMDRAGYKPTTIMCPVCLKSSANPNDIEQGYCGHCHAWTGGVVAYG